jgi:hypothetical protein
MNTEKKVEKIILKICVRYIPSSVKVGSFLLCNPRVKLVGLEDKGTTMLQNISNCSPVHVV